MIKFYHNIFFSKIENLIDNNQVFRRKFSYQFGFQKSGNDQVDLLNFINIIEK
jgi:hypothetical protein